jgi:hypothetical protein
MKKLFLLLALGLLSTAMATAQSRPSVSILGDSYSTFRGFIPDTMAAWYFETEAVTERTDVIRVNQMWWWQLIERMNWKLEVNNSFSGTPVCNTGYRGEDCSARSFIARIPALGNPDIIFIFGGTNDDWARVPMGEFQYDGFRPADLYNFRPGLAFLLVKMKERYPTADLYFLVNSDLREETTGSIHTICARSGVPVIQLEAIDKMTDHPSAKGMTQIADQIIATLK